jgi:hypothetical protein
VSEANPLSIDVKATTSKVSDEDWYGQHQWQCGYERGWDAAMEQKREWVGLTFEEVNKLARALRWHPVERDYIMANAIEAKLKEKNT